MSPANGTSPELLTIRAIADRLGVSRQRAQQIVREKGFPEPGEIVVTYKGWDPRAVDAWAATHRPPEPAPAVPETAPS